MHLSKHSLLLSLSCLPLMQVVVGGEEVATRMIVAIGILGVGEVLLVVVATGIVIEVLAVGRRPPLVAARPKTATFMVVTVILMVAMATTITTTTTDRVILVVHQTRVALGTKVSKPHLSLAACRGLLRMAWIIRRSHSSLSPHHHRTNSHHPHHRWRPTPCPHRSHSRCDNRTVLKPYGIVLVFFLLYCLTLFCLQQGWHYSVTPEH